MFSQTFCRDMLDNVVTKLSKPAQSDLFPIIHWLIN